MNVLMVHGLWRTTLSLRRLGRALAREGHRPEYFAYRPWAESYAAMRDRLGERIAALRAEGEPYALIGHSLGGVLLRDAMARSGGRRPEALILLAAPATAPRAARLAWRVPIFRWLARDAGRQLAEWYELASIPAPECPCLVIAGTRGPRARWLPLGDAPNDGILSVAEASVSATARVATVRATHTFIMNHPDARALIRDALAAPR